MFLKFIVCAITAIKLEYSLADFDFELANKLFANAGKTFSQAKAKSLEFIVDYQSETYPTKGGLLLFGKDREKLFADPIARMIRFEGITKNSAMKKTMHNLFDFIYK